MADKDWKQRVTDEIHASPAFAAAMFGAFGAVLGAAYASMNSTPAKREQFKQDVTRDERQARVRARVLLRQTLKKSYFAEGPGKDLLEARAFVAIQAAEPFPDGIFERGPVGTHGGLAFNTLSEAGGARLSAFFDAYDGYGEVRLSKRGGQRLKGHARFQETTLIVHPFGDVDEWIENLPVMARLIATPGSFCPAVKIRRSNHDMIRDRIWQEYLQEHPHIASAIEDAEQAI